MAIMRQWHGEVALEKADEYEKFMVERAAPDYSSLPGLLHLFFTRKDELEISHFLLVTIWDSVESVKKFAGEDVEIAKYYPEDDAFLLSKEKYTIMYDIFFQKKY